MTELSEHEKPAPAIRDALFGDMPFSEWPRAAPTLPQEVEPWLSFVHAREQFDAGDEAAAKEALRRILKMPDLESRHYLQAWHFLRGMGEEPPTGEAKKIYGVVVEVPQEDGLDIVAAYLDHTARYFNYSGAAVIWERPDDSLDLTIDELLEAGRVVAEQIGPWQDERPPAPPAGQARINLLVPSGLHFGEGPFEALSSDPLGGPVILSATRLMMALIARTESGHA
jgi:hypothetical protein